MMIVRSRGGWLRRAIASGATFVALGAVLVGPSSASAAPPAELAAPSLSLPFGSCGSSSPKLVVDGANVPDGADIPDGPGVLRIEGFRANGASVSNSQLVTATGGAFRSELQIQVGDYSAVEIVLNRTVTHPPVDDGGFDTTETFRIASVWYFVGCPFLSTDPFEQVGDAANPAAPNKVTVQLSGFRPDIPVALSVPGSTVTPPTLNPTTANPVVTTEVTVDPGACGLRTITATQETLDPIPDPPVIKFAGTAPVKAALAGTAHGPNRVTTADFIVYCPRLTATPARFSDTALPQPIALGGDGWIPDATVTVSMDGKVIGSARTDVETGALSIAGTIPQTDCGRHTLDAVQVDDRPVIGFASASLYQIAMRGCASIGREGAQPRVIAATSAAKSSLLLLDAFADDVEHEAVDASRLAP